MIEGGSTKNMQERSRPWKEDTRKKTGLGVAGSDAGRRRDGCRKGGEMGAGWVT